MTRRNVSPISGNGLSNIPPSQTSSSKIEAENAMRSTTRNRSVWLDAGFSMQKYASIPQKTKSVYKKPKQKISSKSGIIKKKNSK